ncbi:MAG: hypothetical protein ACLFPL_03605 [Candidatus Nanoarchaeia archaeon]
MISTIQKLYNQKEFFEQAQAFFNQEGFIQLQQFFEESNDLNTFTTQMIKSNNYSMFYNPLIEQKHLFNETNTPSSLLASIEYFKSKTFEQYIEELVGFSLTLQRVEISKFTHKCFELLHDSKVADSMLIDVYYFITQDEFESEYGGDKVYTTYNEELFYITPQHNTLTCVFRDDEMRQYTKYINSLAKEKQYIQIKCVYEIQGSLDEELM